MSRLLLAISGSVGLGLPLSLEVWDAPAVDNCMFANKQRVGVDFAASRVLVKRATGAVRAFCAIHMFDLVDPELPQSHSPGRAPWHQPYRAWGQRRRVPPPGEQQAGQRSRAVALFQGRCLSKQRLQQEPEKHSIARWPQLICLFVG
jgi:hypothetical protein